MEFVDNLRQIYALCRHTNVLPIAVHIPPCSQSRSVVHAHVGWLYAYGQVALRVAEREGKPGADFSAIARERAGPVHDLYMNQEYLNAAGHALLAGRVADLIADAEAKGQNARSRCGRAD